MSRPAIDAILPILLLGMAVATVIAIPLQPSEVSASIRNWRTLFRERESLPVNFLNI